jgi:hypothetical protein
VPRIADLYAALPAITGKMELEYEGELHGAEKIARELIQQSAARTFDVRAGGADVEDIIEYFETGGALQVGEDAASTACVRGFETVPGLLELVESVGSRRPRATASCLGVRARARGARRPEAHQPHVVRLRARAAPEPAQGERLPGLRPDGRTPALRRGAAERGRR